MEDTEVVGIERETPERVEPGGRESQRLVGMEMRNVGACGARRQRKFRGSLA